ncbi:MAG TPA: hypothetical protein VFW85_03915 [Gaiellaceae bacterium]|nr:hypothetical protein [Gaiellaceae bacterium]
MRFRRFTILAGLVALVVLGATTEANAKGGRPQQTTSCGAMSTPFAHWGDQGQYYFPGNAGFESGSDGWTLSGGATVVSGNEPWFVHSTSDAYSLQIPNGGSATTTICIDQASPELRFFAIGKGAKIKVSLAATKGPKAAAKLDGGKWTSNGNWNVSPPISTVLSSATSRATNNSVQVTFTVSGGTAQIDDLYVDPFALKR